MPTTHQPQTLRQAKKAYRKSGATVRLSESELAISERRSVLQERADRIKEREARRKANIKRKEERNQREREARARMGIKEQPKEGTTHVGPSQLSLGGFLGGGRKRARDSEEDGNAGVSRITTGATRAERDFWRDQEERDCRTPPIQRIPWRNPLKIITANSTAGRASPGGSTSARVSAAGSPSQKKATPPSSSRDSLRAKPPLHITSHATPAASAQNVGCGKYKEPAKVDTRIQVAQMAPPSLPRSVGAGPGNQQRPHQKAKGSETSIRGESRTECRGTGFMAPHVRGPSVQSSPTNTKARQNTSITAPSDKPPDPVDDSWDDIFVSGTQIARELSPPIRKPTPIARPVSHTPSAPSLPPPPMPHKTELQYPNTHTLLPQTPLTRHPTNPQIPPTSTPKDTTTLLLDQISTQDLDFFETLNPPPPYVKPSMDFNNKNDTNDLLAQICTQDLDFSLEPTQRASPRAPSTDFDEDLTEEDLEDVALEFERESTMAGSRTTTSFAQKTCPGPATKQEDKDIKQEQPKCTPSKPANPPRKPSPSPSTSTCYSSPSLDPFLDDSTSQDIDYATHIQLLVGDWDDSDNNDSHNDDSDYETETLFKEDLDLKMDMADYYADTFDLSTQDWCEF